MHPVHSPRAQGLLKESPHGVTQLMPPLRHLLAIVA